MKNIKFLTALLFTLWVLQVQAAKVQVESVSLVVNIWPPYVDTSLADDGLAMKIVKTAFKRAGYNATVRIEKWEKALEGSKIGAYDVAGAIWKTKERQTKLLYSNAYLSNNIVLIAHVNNQQIKFNSLSDLQGILVGVLKDYEYDDKFMKDPKILKFQANRLTQNLIAVEQGKLDVAVADKRLAQYELKHFMGNNINNFQFLSKPLSSRKLYIAAPIANAQSKTLIKQFNKGLAAIKKDGTYQKILDEYTF